MNAPRVVRGIRDKLVLAFAGLLTSIALFVFLFFPARLERQAFDATVARAGAIADMAAYSLAAGLMFEDSTAVAEVVVGASRPSDVAYMAVWHHDGRLMASRGEGHPIIRPTAPVPGRVTPDGRTLLTVTNVSSGTVQVGTLALGISLAPLRAEVIHARRMGALVGVLILGVGVLAIFAISTYLTHPLKAVTATVNRIAEGDLTTRAVEPRDVELRGLVRAFNRMVDTLVGAQGELAAMNTELEGRVAARTVELTQAITGLQESQQALAVSEQEARSTSELLQSLIDVAPQAIIVVDTDWLVVRWNLAAERLFGWSAAELLGKPLPYADADIRERADALVAATQNGTAVEVERPRKDGTKVRVLAACAQLRAPDGAPAGYIGIMSDLSERKRLEEQLRKSQKMEAVGRLAGGVAHDFNNILTIITACTELLMHEDLGGEGRSLVEHISGAALRAAALTRQLLTFTRQDVVQPRRLEMATVLRGLDPMLRRVLPANIRLSTEVADHLGVVRADPTQLEQVVMNLVLNAADAMPEGGSLEIELEAESLDREAAAPLGIAAGRYNKLVVRDSGIGMDEAVQARIFDPFFTTKEVGKGTGLGLATAYSIITALQGSIRVHSAPGEGATFEVRIPDSISPVTGEHPAVKLPSEVARAPDKLTVLVVEDDPPVRNVVRRSLERSGYHVIEATDGEEGLSLAAAHGAEIGAVITDMMMPGMGGLAFAEALRASHPALGVVCISGYSENHLNGANLLDSRHVFVQKPFSIDELLDAIAKVIPQQV
jgi:two-component system cell cycle sensor histidine kinase/response regulator CckA